MDAMYTNAAAIYSFLFPNPKMESISTKITSMAIISP